jgi:hypothetical protein
MARTCGECTACCVALGVPEIDKAAGDSCPHLSQRCSIYDRRPYSCQAYRCLWLQGLFHNQDRPDLLGLVIDTSERDGPLGPAGGVIVIREVTPNAWERAAAFQASLPSSLPIYVKLLDGRRIIREGAK